MAEQDLAGRVALVTGGARGMGAAIARTLASAGAKVVIADQDRDGADRTANEITAAGGGAVGVACDVTDYASVVSAVDAATSRLGPVDLLVANAGIGDYADMASGDVQTWRRVIDVNILGVMHAVRATLSPMRDQKSGDIVIMASIAGRETWASEPVYIATKHALVGLGSALRKQCLDFGVRVTLIEPALVDTEMVSATEAGRDELARYASLRPSDVAGAVLFAVTRPQGVGIAELMIRAVGSEP